MSKATTKATQAVPAAQDPETLDIYGVQRFFGIDGTALVLEDHALSKIRAALAAISTCTDILNAREMARTNGEPTTEATVAHGLLAAIDCATELLKLHIEDENPEGVTRLRGKHAQAIKDQAYRAWNVARIEEGGR